MSEHNNVMSARTMPLRTRRASRLRAIAATVCALSMISTPAALAVDANPVEKRKTDPQETNAQAKQADQQRDAAAEQLATRLHDAGQLIGSDVYDATDREKQVGTLHEIVIDSRTGEVKYGVLSAGGLMGFGDKLFAVPWSAFDFAATPEADEAPRIFAPISEQKLEEADGFDQANWPDMADQQWSKATHERWGQKDQAQQEGQRAQQGQAGRDRIQQGKAENEGRDAMARRAQSGEMLRVSTLIGLDVTNTTVEDESIGEIARLFVTEHDGRIAYAELSLGGEYAEGDKNRVAVPWGALDAQTAQGEDDELQITLDADKRTIQTVAYTEDQQPQMSDLTWARHVHRTFGQDANMTVLGYTNGSDAQQVSARTDGWRQDSDYNKSYDARQNKPFSGTIQSVGTFTPDNDSAQGTKLTIETAEGETHELHLGPKGYMSGQQLNLKEDAEVTGSGHQPEGKDYIMVNSLTVDGKTVELRDRSGKASWNTNDQRQDRQQNRNRATDQRDRKDARSTDDGADDTQR